ncbi:hypothetical protein AEMCBJ_32800 (plasmid) [Cupriavidus necator]
MTAPLLFVEIGSERREYQQKHYRLLKRLPAVLPAGEPQMFNASE